MYNPIMNPEEVYFLVTRVILLNQKQTVHEGNSSLALAMQSDRQSAV